MPPAPKYSNPDDIREIGATYFAECEEKDKPPTMAGLALRLGFVDRQSIYDYEKRPLFSCVIKELRTRVEEYHESRLAGQTCTGSIFWLKNHQWRDERQTDNRHTIDLSGMSDEELRRIIAGEDA